MYEEVSTRLYILTVAETKSPTMLLFHLPSDSSIISYLVPNRNGEIVRKKWLVGSRMCFFFAHAFGWRMYEGPFNPAP